MMASPYCLAANGPPSRAAMQACVLVVGAALRAVRVTGTLLVSERSNRKMENEMADRNIVTETLTYEGGGVTMQGYIAYDANEGPRPGVMIIHEWWGLDDYIKSRARQVAELGYTAVALDMYGDGKVAANSDEAGALMMGVLGDMESGTARLKAGHAAMCAHANTDGTRTASMGYCFGGAVSLHAARIGMDLRAVASFHGSLGSFHTPEVGSVKPKILVCHGAADVLIPADDVTAFKAEMDGAGADYEFVEYEGALHGFTNPGATAKGKEYGLPLAYDEKTDNASWAAMTALYAETLA
jgi:dienelactone hydrolase